MSTSGSPAVEEPMDSSPSPIDPVDVDGNHNNGSTTKDHGKVVHSDAGIDDKTNTIRSLITDTRQVASSESWQNLPNGHPAIVTCGGGTTLTTSVSVCASAESPNLSASMTTTLPSVATVLTSRLPNGDIKRESSAPSASLLRTCNIGGPNQNDAADSHIKTESPDTTASNEAIRNVIDRVAKQEILENGLLPGVVLVNGPISAYKREMMFSLPDPSTASPKVPSALLASCPPGVVPVLHPAALRRSSGTMLPAGCVGSQTPPNGDVSQMAAAGLSSTVSAAASAVSPPVATIAQPAKTIPVGPVEDSVIESRHLDGSLKQTSLIAVNGSLTTGSSSSSSGSSSSSTIIKSSSSDKPTGKTSSSKQQGSAAKGSNILTSSELSLSTVLEYLRKHNLQETEKILKRESRTTGLSSTLTTDGEEIAGSGIGLTGVRASALAHTGPVGPETDPETASTAYTALQSFIEASLDSHRPELATLLYPIFVHLYTALVTAGHRTHADAFLDKFAPLHEEYWQEDIRQLAFIHRPDQVAESQMLQNLRKGQYAIRMCRDTYNALKRFLLDKKHYIVHNIVQDSISVDVYEGIARSRQQVEAVSGSVMGESTRQLNKAKVYYGLPKEPTIIVEEEDDVGVADEGGSADGGGGKPKKKKSKRDSALAKKTRADPNAPPANRIPLPELRDADKLDRLQALKEAARRVRLGAKALPSICFYTLVNSHLQVTAVEINEEATMMGVGLQDARIRVFSLTPNKLKAMKSASELETIDREAEDVLYRMMDERSASDFKTLAGHQGVVTSLSFSPDKQFLLSGSEDGTIRLWSLLTWSNVVAYRGHVFPVWSVQFAPAGYYFASCGHDRTARLWTTDSYQPIRLFAGHYSDVDVVQFHPNSNYVATGSTDRSVRLWDVLNGACVRHMTGHKSTVYALAFSTCGRFLCSAGTGGRILVWDVGSAHLLADLWSHSDTIHRLSFSREGSLLASGGMDCAVKLWDFSRLATEFDLDEVSGSNAPTVRTATDGAHDGLLLSTYPTKGTSILALHFTRKNLLLASGSPV